LKSLAQSSKTAVPDAELLSRIHAGDLESLGTLFDRYERDVRRFLARLGVQSADLDDLVQLTFIEVTSAAHGFDGRSSARGWLLGVAATINRRHRRTFARMVARLNALAGAFHAPTPETPAEAVEGLEAEARVARALDALSDKKREAFVLVTLEGASGEEAAAALGVPLNTVWTRLHHAREELRAQLLEESS